MLVFTCEELGIPPIEYGMHPNCLEPWHEVMNTTKSRLNQLLARYGLDIPVSLLFSRVGVIGEAQDGRHGVFSCKKVFVGIDPLLAAVFDEAQSMPAGTYLYIGGVCSDVFDSCSGLCMTKYSMDRLFDFAAKHRFKTDGLCYTECLPDPLALRTASVETLNRTRLRILED